MKDILLIGLIILTVIGGCSRGNVPLSQKQFVALLIDMHMADGTLSVGDYRRNNDKEDYAYYNAVFKKYGITKTDFEKSLSYYQSQTALFSTMYDIVIDSLNARLTEKNRVLADLRVRDSVNLFPVTDTIMLDKATPLSETIIDSIMPGLYKFNMMIKFDVPDKGKNNRITAFFLSEDSKDTLHVHKVGVVPDTIVRLYSWSQYVDSLYNRLVIKFVDSDNLNKLDERKARAWEVNLVHPYVSSETEARLKKALEISREKKNSDTNRP